MFQVVEVKLREGGRITYHEIDDLRPKPGDLVIVEADRGLDYGEVLSDVEMILQKDLEEPLRKVKRIATKEDLAQIKKNKEKIKDVLNICLRKIQERNILMKLVEAEYSFDRTKIILYFTAEGRIDFGALFSDAKGTGTAVRAYWENRDTQIVTDIPSEAQLKPGNWGVMKLEE